MLLHCARAAPLSTIIRDLKAGWAGAELGSTLEEIRDGLRALEDSRGGHEDQSTQVKTLQERRERLDGQTKQHLLEEVERLGQERDHQLMHIVSISANPPVWHGSRSPTRTHPSVWQALCGWHFATSHFRREMLTEPHDDTIDKRLCERCFPTCFAEP